MLISHDKIQCTVVIMIFFCQMKIIIMIYDLSIQFAEFDEVMQSDPDKLSKMILKVKQWLISKQWRKVIYGAISVQKCMSFLNLSIFHNKIEFDHSNFGKGLITCYLFYSIQKNKVQTRECNCNTISCTNDIGSQEI